MGINFDYPLSPASYMYMELYHYIKSQECNCTLRHLSIFSSGLLLKHNLHAPISKFPTQVFIVGRIPLHTIVGSLNSIYLHFS